MQPLCKDGIRKPSSATTSAEDESNISTALDDVTIAQALLNSSVQSAAQFSGTGTSKTFGGHVSSPRRDQGRISIAREYTDGRPRRGFQTSNTWTSSDGEVPSEMDEIDDRTLFVQEYNRLAKRVCIYDSSPLHVD